MQVGQMLSEKPVPYIRLHLTASIFTEKPVPSEKLIQTSISILTASIFAREANVF
jgi:hypothetical protein